VNYQYRVFGGRTVYRTTSPGTFVTLPDGTVPGQKPHPTFLVCTKIRGEDFEIVGECDSRGVRGFTAADVSDQCPQQGALADDRLAPVD